MQNHPSSSSFSSADIGTMGDLKCIKVIGYDGTRYSLQVGNGMRSSFPVIEEAFYYNLEKSGIKAKGIVNYNMQI